MGKSSSSKRERRSNASSSARRKKTDGSKTKKKKSDKSSRRRRHALDTSSSESDYDRSFSPSSDSDSSSEDDNRSRQSRSFSRKDGRRSKKRVRRDSHLLTSDEGSPPSKRRKVSKRKGGGFRSRRKSGRSRYVRDASGDYSSCSTCENRSSREDEYEIHRGRSDRRESRADMRANRSKDRSGSCSTSRRCSRSSCGQDGMFSGDSRSEERATDENNSKRLRSVIVVVNAEERIGEENKEEIVYDKDDYPSSRSNDSNDDESKKDVLDMKGMFESGKGKEVVSKLHAEPSGAGGNWQDGNQGNSRASLGANQEDLETMLRERALQNLQKLRGIKKATTSHDTQEPTVAAAEEPVLPREDQVNATGATSRDSPGDVAKKNRIIKEKSVYATRSGMVPTGKQSGCAFGRTVVGIPSQEVLPAVAPACSNPWRTAYTWRREPALSQSPVKQLVSPQKPKPLQQIPKRTETSATIIAAENPPRESALNQLPTKNLISPMVTKTTVSGCFAESHGNESALSVSPAKELSLPKIPKAFQANPAVPETATTVVLTASTSMSGRNGNVANQTTLNKVPQQSSLAAYQSTDSKGALGTEGSEKVVDVVKEGPQYEQKTMAVTRGGETIQVNYQVYIPKRTPALARRQLKRYS